LDEVNEKALNKIVGELVPAAENVKHDVLDVVFVDIPVG